MLSIFCLPTTPKRGSSVLSNLSVAQVVLAELARDITVRLEELRDRRVLVAYPLLRARHANFRQTDTEGELAGDNGLATGRAALLGVVIGKQSAFFGDPVYIGCLVTH